MADLETKDKSFNSSVKQAAWFVGFAVSIVVATVSITKYVKSEMNETVKSAIQIAISEIMYDVKDFKSIKIEVADHDKAISLLQYRIGAAEEKINIPSINKNIRVEELNGSDPKRKQKDVDDNS